ncbi:MAG TPA: response regulator [Flavisolibacter sp.]|nr:response regulator [Flavisolibacter sp.]
MVIECFLIDDDQDDQEIFLMALQKIDAQISCLVAKDGLEGLKKLSENVSYIPGYIFIDINMHKMNGMECLQRIKELDHLKNSRIIMFSTSSEVKIIQQCKRLGANDFLTKPPGLAPLVTSLNNILKR